MPSAQEIFDQIVSHLRAQGSAAKDATGQCKYRARDGKRCAVGCLIPDNLYSSNMEARIVSNLLEDFPCLAFLNEHLNLLHDMQCIHDADPPSHWEFRFQMMAQRYCLKYTSPSS